MQKNPQLKQLEEVEIAADEESDDNSKDADDKMDSDCDVYICTYWDNFKVSEAQEAINYIEESLKNKCGCSTRALANGHV